MVGYRRILLIGIAVASLAAWARADDDDPTVARSPWTDSAQSPIRSKARLFGRRDPAIQSAQYAAQPQQPDGALQFIGALVEPQTQVENGPQASFLENEPPGENYLAPREFPEVLDLDAPAPATSSGDWLSRGCWYTEQSVVYMSRSVNVKNQVVLAIDLTSAALTRQQNSLAVDNLSYQPGLRSTVGKRLGRDDHNRDHAVEFTFLGLTQWRAAGGMAAVTPGGIFTLLDFTNAVPAFDGANNQSYTDRSAFNSYELNYRISRRLTHDQMVYTRDSTWVRQCTPTALPSVFAGLRAVTINEHFGYFSQTIGPVLNGAYRVSTHNNMVGPQIGSDWFYDRSEWRFGVRGKGGALVNWAGQTSLVQITDANGAVVPSVQNRNEHANTDILSFVGEVNFIGAYRFTPNFALRTSYDLMWATNLALAQNQPTFVINNPASVAVQHSLFFQGVSVGFEINR